MSAQVGSTLFQSVAANATESNSFEFAGPAAQIPVDIRLLMEVNHGPSFASPAAGADATFGVLSGAGGPQLLGLDVQNAPSTSVRTRNGILTYTLNANQIYTVQARSMCKPLRGTSPRRSSIPWIYIDPSFANAGLYTLLLSDGVGNLGPDSEVPNQGRQLSRSWAAG